MATLRPRSSTTSKVQKTSGRIIEHDSV